VRAILAAAALSLACGGFGAAHARDALQHLVAQTKTTNRAELVTIRVHPERTGLSALAIRSGSLPIMLLAVEVEFSDGASQRQIYQHLLAPGHASPPMPLDPRRAIARVFVTKKPGLRDGETLIQVLGRVGDH
jgi:hypothetical protein